MKLHHEGKQHFPFTPKLLKFVAELVHEINVKFDS